MPNVLIACGDVDTLRDIVGDLPDELEPVATKTATDITKAVADREIRLAVIHEQLADGSGRPLAEQLSALPDPPRILWLAASSTPADGPFDRTIRYPVPGPVLRHALNALRPEESDETDIETWKAFYKEVKQRVAQLDDQSYYDMLGLEAGAAHDAIVEAFDRLSLRYHPDRYTRHRDKQWGRALHDLVRTLYTQLTEAHRVLTDRGLRKAYDRQLDETGNLRLDESSSPQHTRGPSSLAELSSHAKAQKFLRMAQTKLANDDYDGALQNLEFAASIDNSPALEDKIDEIRHKADADGKE
jgi:hypothetical protein